MFRRELKVAVRSLWKAKALSFAIIVTLALGIGVNIAIFSLVRAVLLKPLVNRNEEQIVYIRQAAPGIGSENITFSVPEIQDIRARVKSLTDVAEFSVLSFTVVGLGEPRQVRGGVVSGNYFGVMGLRPVLGRLLNASDDGPAAAAVVVLTHQFWSGTLRSDPNVIGKTIRLNTRSAQVVGVLEPSLPYPAATELIANLASSPHHMGATMSTDRQHRMTEVFARMAPSGTLAATRQELESAYRSVTTEYREAYPAQASFGVSVMGLREQLTSNARTVMVVLFAAALLIFVIACSNVANLILARTVRRESELAVRAAVGAHSSDLRISLLAESLVLCGSGAATGCATGMATRHDAGAVRSAVLRPCARRHCRLQPLDRRGSARPGHRSSPGVRAAAARSREAGRPADGRQQPSDCRRYSASAQHVCRPADRSLLRAGDGRRHAAENVSRAAGGITWFRDIPSARRGCAGHLVWNDAGPDACVLSRSPRTDRSAVGRPAGGGGQRGALARCRTARWRQSGVRDRRRAAGRCECRSHGLVRVPSLRDTSPRSGFVSSRGETSRLTTAATLKKSSSSAKASPGSSFPAERRSIAGCSGRTRF